MDLVEHQLKSQQPRAIFLFGPTASGKTQLAIELHQQINCQLISVDSMMVYRGLDIGSAKPNWQELQQAPHRLIDICDPLQSYSAADFRQDALLAMNEIYATGAIPLLVGGTMLYFKMLMQGHSQLPASDPKIRLPMQAQLASMGSVALYQQLAKVDPLSAKRLHPHDSQRIMRALEVWQLTGLSIEKQWQQAPPKPLPWQIHAIALMPTQRAQLHEVIAQRFDGMLKQGLIEEVEKLVARGDLNGNLPALKSVGYRQVWQYLQGTLDFTSMREKAIIATRQLAKRQMTWIRQWQNAHWLDPNDSNLVTKLREIMYDLNK